MLGSLLVARSTAEGSLHIYKTNPNDQVSFMTNSPTSIKYPLPECPDQSQTSGKVYSTDTVLTVENCKSQVLTIQSSVKFAMEAAPTGSWFNWDLARYLP